MTDFVLLIHEWYRQNARILPWRETQNPYFIWLSEVILQQTRVDQGLKYYYSFTENFPTIKALAEADEQEVLKLWQGLGYYSRARNLHATAKQILELHNGEFPATYNEIIALKGIGPYTAAAISSFAFKLPHAVVDGNVYRILSRYFGIDEPIDTGTGQKNYQSLANELIPEAVPDLHNQAIMEFGAMQCKPKNPDCETCVLASSCASYGTEAVNTRPIKSKKTKVSDRYFHYFHIKDENKTAWIHRKKKDIWQHLNEFPMIETTTAELPSNLFAEPPLAKFEAKHILSHQRIQAYFYETNEKHVFAEQEIEWKTANEDPPTHRLMEKYLEQLR